MKTANIKLQYEQIRLDPHSSGLFINRQPGFHAGGKVNVVSTTVDFAF